MGGREGEREKSTEESSSVSAEPAGMGRGANEPAGAPGGREGREEAFRPRGGARTLAFFDLALVVGFDLDFLDLTLPLVNGREAGRFFLLDTTHSSSLSLTSPVWLSSWLTSTSRSPAGGGWSRELVSGSTSDSPSASGSGSNGTSLAGCCTAKFGRKV